MTLADYQKDPNRIGTDFIKYYYTKLSTNSSKIYQLYTKDAVCKHMNPTSDPFKNQAEEIHGIEKIKKYWKSQPPISNAKIVILTVNTIQNSDGSLVITVVGEILLREDYDSDDDTILPTRTFTQTFILQQHAVKDNFEVKSDILTYIPNTDYMNAVIYEEEEPVELVVVEEEEEFPEKGGRGALRDVGEAPEEDAEGEETKKQKGKCTHLTGSEMEESTAPGGIYNKSQAETNNKQKAVSTLEEDVNSTEGSVKKHLILINLRLLHSQNQKFLFLPKKSPQKLVKQKLLLNREPYLELQHRFLLCPQHQHQLQYRMIRIILYHHHLQRHKHHLKVVPRKKNVYLVFRCPVQVGQVL